MTQIPIYRDSHCVGTMEVVQDGLYWRINALCTGNPLERLWLHTANHQHCLGPLEPYNGLMRCRGRISRASLENQSILHAVVQPNHGSWKRLNSSAVHGKLLDHVLVNACEFAVPFDLDAPFPFPAQFCLCRVDALFDSLYVIIPIEIE